MLSSRYADKLKELRKIGVTNRANLVLNTLERKLGRTRLLSYPVSLDIIPTTACNIRCIFCIQYTDNHPMDLSLEGFKRIAKTLFPYATRVSFCTGGEPFLNRNFMEFLEICKRYKILTVVVSNGTVLSESICKELMRNDHLETFSFSFDGARKETVESIRRGVDYEQVVNNIRMMCDIKRTLKQGSPSVHIRYSVMKKNIEELPDLIRQAGAWGVEKVTVSYLNVANKMDKNESLYYHPELKKRYFEESVRVAKELNVQLGMPESEPEEARVVKCSFPWSFMKIDPDGAVRFCYKAWEHPIGNFFDTKKFGHLWNNRHYQLIRKTVNSDRPYFKYCSVCNIRTGCNAEASHIKDLGSGLYEFDKNR